MEEYAKEAAGKEQFAGLDVSLRDVSICVSDGAGQVLWRGDVINDAAALASALSRRAPHLARCVLETGSCGAIGLAGGGGFGPTARQWDCEYRNR